MLRDALSTSRQPSRGRVRLQRHRNIEVGGATLECTIYGSGTPVVLLANAGLQHDFPDAERDAQLGRCHGSRGFPAGTLLMKSPDPRPTLAAPDDDPYLWLEEIE